MNINVHVIMKCKILFNIKCIFTSMTSLLEALRSFDFKKVFFLSFKTSHSYFVKFCWYCYDFTLRSWQEFWRYTYKMWTFTVSKWQTNRGKSPYSQDRKCSEEWSFLKKSEQWARKNEFCRHRKITTKTHQLLYRSKISSCEIFISF
jgi:hypothetical protein